MKICILTFGTRGDVQPYVALGLGLKAAGHTSTAATFLEATVVHHGGCTTGAALRVGKPTVVCPFVGDQPF